MGDQETHPGRPTLYDSSGGNYLCRGSFFLSLSRDGAFEDEERAGGDERADYDRQQVERQAVDDVRDEHDPDAAMWNVKLALEEHRERAGDSRADHDGRDDAERVFSSERDGSLGDKGEAKYPGSFASFALVMRKAVLEEDGCQSETKRWGHASRHHRSHWHCDVAAEQADREGVGRFVDRATHVEGHHQAEQQTKQDCIASLHGLQ